MIMDNRALFKLSYGLFVLTARQDGKDNGCIINTAMQITDDPKRISVAVNKQNLTHDMIFSTGEFNLSVLSEDAVFWIFQHYGFQSGRDTDKFANIPETRTDNGVRYVDGCTNAVISGKVISTVDCGTHTLFIADVSDAKVLSDVPSMTYQYYFDHVKPKPEPAKKASWVCKICGYVYEGDPLPEDFICPWCKHGAEDFEKQ
jgi:flavin reductase (DIM6/NTAB) family NADH-FMN oxidoreductase RutF